MERINISSTLEMSRLVYGMWRLGDDEDTAPGHVRNKIASCLDQGITPLIRLIFMVAMKLKKF